MLPFCPSTPWIFARPNAVEYPWTNAEASMRSSLLFSLSLSLCLHLACTTFTNRKGTRDSIWDLESRTSMPRACWAQSLQQCMLPTWVAFWWHAMIGKRLCQELTWTRRQQESRTRVLSQFPFLPGGLHDSFHTNWSLKQPLTGTDNCRKTQRKRDIWSWTKTFCALMFCLLVCNIGVRHIFANTFATIEVSSRRLCLSSWGASLLDTDRQTWHAHQHQRYALEQHCMGNWATSGTQGYFSTQGRHKVGISAASHADMNRGT